jgi:ribose/xylose/arabinose/galactoside ABC-type transport system permease subunit
MTDHTSAAGAVSGDERITFRGPVQRMLISPEIGALIGTIMVWALFWATSTKFSTAPTTASWLDGAAPLGIMAVAVALLMIGGEFDLSAGVITGSTGILVGLFAQKFMGDGATMWLAVPIAFLAAALIGWLNGTFVNRTGLPSFIVTLATFFVLRGVNLVFSKRMVDKVLVENIDEVKDFEPFRKVFASTHTLESFSLRDTLLIVLPVIGAVLLVAGLLEQSLVRRERIAPKGLAVLGVGAVAALLGLWMVHHSDGVGANWLWGTVGLTGAVVAAAGWAEARYVTGGRPGGWMVPAARRPLAAGLAFTVLAFVITRLLDAKQERVLLSIPPHAVKVLIGVVAAVAGVAVSASLGLKRMRANVGGARRSRLSGPKLVFVSLVSGLSALVAVLAFLQLCTEQGFRSLVQVGLGGLGILALLSAKSVATRQSGKAQLLIAVLAAGAILFNALVVRHDAGSERFRSGFVATMALLAALVLGNAIVEMRQTKRTVIDTKADGRGRVLAFSGVAIALLGVAIRLLWSGAPVRVSILWWIIVTLVAAAVLARSRWGNWIFAVGGNKDAARAVGVPVDQVKVGLFMMVSLVGCLVGMMTALRYTSVAASQGVGEEFEYIIAAVVGGCLLTGGYGSVIGASFGAMISAMLATGIPGARWNTDNKYIFLGAVLFLAVLVNQKVRKKAQEAR